MKETIVDFLDGFTGFGHVRRVIAMLASLAILLTLMVVFQTGDISAAMEKNTDLKTNVSMMQRELNKTEAALDSLKEQVKKLDSTY
jgi:F0F1-type ATP synthase membrane subunit b/b'